MNGRGPINRKKTIVGRADQDSMKTHGEGLGEGPVGDAQGNQARKDAQTGGPGRAVNARPRPQQPGQATGSMNTHGSGMGASRPQQTRPVGGYTQQSQGAKTSRPLNLTGGSSSSSGKKGFNPLILIILAVVLLGGGGGLSGLFGGGSDTSNTTTTTNSGFTSANTGSSSSTASGLLESLLGGDSSYDTGSSYTGSSSSYTGSGSSSYAGSSASSSGILGSSAFSGYGSDLLQSLLGGSWYGSQVGYGDSGASSYAGSDAYAGSGFSFAGSTAAGNAIQGASSGTGSDGVNRNVAAGSRAKYTQLLGNGRDTFTLMVYMCGADLESRSAMATRDLQEMAAAKYGDNVRVVVYTGGSKKWQNSLVSSSVNQVWQVVNGANGGGLVCLEKNAGTGAMTDPNTLSSFIRYCAQKFPASRYALILWDHGSGSVSGYGYDEKNARTGAMSLAGLNSAFQSGGVKFDFIGYDACLMATLENALMCAKYADYLIASEETEPGIGWYYTGWLNAVGQNTSISTLDIGKTICDDFVTQCNRQCRGQQTTLSIVDLAEVENTVPAKFAGFSKSISTMISNSEYRTVSNARNGTREFAQSSRIDQVDLTDLCNNLGTSEAKALASVLTEAVKYNRTNNITHAYGLSVYFPYQKVSNVDKAVSTYAAIGLDSSYSQAIRDFAGMEASGQAVSGGTSSAIPSLFGLGGYGSGGSSYGTSAYGDSDMISDLLSSFLGGGYSSVSGLSGSNAGFLTGRSVADDVQYLTSNMLDTSQLAFQQDGDNWVLSLTPEMWSLVHGVDLNLFYDNGEGYVDLGLDNLFEFDDQGRLVADTQGTWLAINGQPVPYYHETSDFVSDSEWRITGRVPALLNGERVNLLIVFDAEHESGYVAGARSVYDESETETVAKSITELSDGDKIEFLADLYDYDQNYTDSYRFGDEVTVSGELSVGDVYLPDASKCLATYRITDIYNQAYWTPVIGR